MNQSPLTCSNVQVYHRNKHIWKESTKKKQNKLTFIASQRCGSSAVSHLHHPFWANAKGFRPQLLLHKRFVWETVEYLYCDNWHKVDMFKWQFWFNWESHVGCENELKNQTSETTSQVCPVLFIQSLMSTKQMETTIPRHIQTSLNAAIFMHSHESELQLLVLSVRWQISFQPFSSLMPTVDWLKKTSKSARNLWRPVFFRCMQSDFIGIVRSNVVVKCRKWRDRNSNDCILKASLELSALKLSEGWKW